MVSDEWHLRADRAATPAVFCWPGPGLRGAVLVAETACVALERPGMGRGAALDSYRRARRRAFAGKWAVERLIGYGMLVPRLFDRAVARLERRGLAHTLIGVTGDFVPAREVLNPSFIARMLV
jgi:hypothetical protein